MSKNLIFVIFLASYFISLCCIFLAKRAQIGVDSIHSNSPQKMHLKNTSRIGGLSIFITFVLGYFIFFYQEDIIFTIIGLCFVFMGGFLEDLKGTMKPIKRLLIQSVGVMVMLLDNLGIIYNLEPLIVLPWTMAIVFSIFGIVGVCNALNIIDGLNGLASGVAMIVLGAIAFVSRDINGFVFIFCILAIAGTLGFFILNFPFGRIFLGDGGAYFLGALIGILLAILSNNGISAWFGLSVMIYPVWEVLYSIFRRKLDGKKAMQPDSLHLHSLVFKILKNNALSGFVILFGYGIYVICVLSLAKTANDFIIASLCFILFYSIIYKSLRLYLSKR
ncbi:MULTISPECIES: glycosyltransferase family 4 protein [unclassified Helicobacter]|uniref:glycosyltransferase family 4 protein n=1 Tax=unclassified Helicobacter TaxID=2593540 RepID=UPI000CF0BA4D|nr:MULTISPECIES: MraY family glycosyltransferase [unclassified Helicobacter]